MSEPAQTTGNFQAALESSSQQSTPRDEERIRINLTAYLDASGEYGHAVYRAAVAKEAMKRALRDLRAAGGHAEAEKYAGSEGA